MYSARVEVGFSAAHYLNDYNGKCENLHGHNYKVRVWVKGQSLGYSGMLADFSILKKILREICIKLDHSNLNEIKIFNNNPSSERIAKYIYEQFKKILSGYNIETSILNAVDVFETETSMARYGESKYPAKGRGLLKSILKTIDRTGI